MSKRFVTVLVLLLPWCAAAAPPVPRDLRVLMQQFHVPEAHVGLYVAPVEKDDVLMSLNPRRPFNPASVIKLLPSIAALDVFSPAYQWATRVYKTGPVTNGTLHGNLYIKGGGDPYMTVESLWALLKTVHSAGIDRIAGDIVVDDGIFELPRFDRAAFDDKPYRIYNGPASGLLVNFWAVRFTITGLADTVNIDAFPDSRRLKIVNHIKHSNARCTRARRYIGYRVEDAPDSVVVTFSGTLSSRCLPIIITRAVIPGDRYLSYILPSVWRDAGGSLDGEVRRGEVPDDAARIHTHLSRTMAEVVQATNKFSNNLMARHLLLTLGTLDKARGVTVADGIQALNDWLLSRGIDVPGLHMINGSGLARDTRVSVVGLANVLRAGFYSRYAPEFLASFPIAGEDWALESRKFAESDVSVVRMKTGLIDDVRAMAGYVTSRSGRTYIVVLLVNHKGVHQGIGTQMQNAVIRYVLDQ